MLGSDAAFTSLVQAVGRMQGPIALLRRWIGRFPEGSVTSVRLGAAGGLRWKRFHRYRNAFWLGTYEPMVQRAIVDRLRPGDVFYDIGANAGFLSLVAARAVGPTGQVVSFDPDPENLESLSEQPQLNGFDHWTAVQTALGEVAGRQHMLRPKPGSSDARLEHGGKSANDGDEKLLVKVMTLDEAAATWRTPNLVKIDVEGAEALVIRGGRRTLLESKPTLIVEVHGPEVFAEISELFAQLGYHHRFLGTTSGEWSRPRPLVAGGEAGHDRPATKP